MIQKVSHVSSFPTFQKSNDSKTKEKRTISSDKKAYMDSFIKNTKESAPMLLGLTALWSVLDYGTGKAPISKVLTNNILCFFAPVLLFSSALMASIENKKTSKSSKP